MGGIMLLPLAVPILPLEKMNETLLRLVDLEMIRPPRSR
jgi:hypothetical protein